MSMNEPNFTGMTECQLAHYCQELILKDTPKRTPMLPTLGEASALSSQTWICDKGGGALCKDDITKFGFVEERSQLPFSTRFLRMRVMLRLCYWQHVHSYCQYIFYGHIIMTVADPGEGPSSPLILDQTEVPRAEKILFETSPPTPRPPAPYLRAWLSGPPLIWRSGSATDSLLSLTDLFLKDTPVALLL